MQKYLIYIWLISMLVRAATLPWGSDGTWIAMAVMSKYFWSSLAILGAALVITILVDNFLNITLK